MLDPTDSARQRGLLRGHELFDTSASEVQQRIQFAALEGMAFGRTLNLNKAAGVVHHDIHVGFGGRIFGVVEVQHWRAAANADRNRRHVTVNRVALEQLAGEQAVDRINQGDIGARDRGRAGAAIGLNDIAVQRDLALAQRFEIDHGAQAAADQPLDFLGSAGLLATGRLAAHSVVRRARQHAVFGRDPAAILVAQPGRHTFINRGRAEHAGIAKANQHRAFGVFGEMAGEGDLTQLVGCAATGALKGVSHGRGVYRAAPPEFAILRRMIKSMTGFARHQATGTWGQLVWELRTVNHRYLDVSFRLPEPMRALESEFRTRIGRRVARGKCEASLKLDLSAGEQGSLDIDPARLQSLASGIRQVSEAMDVQPPDPLRVLAWPGVVQQAELDQEALNTAALESLDAGLDALAEARQREGDKIDTMLCERADGIESLVVQVTDRLPALRTEWEARLRERLADFKTELDESRIEQEFLLLLNRTDAAEELDRLNAHTQEIRAILKRREPVGRRLDFLIQELNREANTLGSKSQDTEVTRAAVDLKVLIEQMREQVQNVE